VFLATKLTSRVSWSVDDVGGCEGVINVAFWFGRACELGWRGG
jgi:hypothetical protein